MKNIKIILIMLLLLSSTVSVSAAADIPRIEPYVNDFAGLLTPAEELQLNLLADEIEQNTTFEIAIVTIDGTGGQDRVEFAGKIGDLNGVGKKDADNGIVVMWSTADDFGGAIATGRGSESFLTDATVGRIGRESRGYFDKGEYAVAFDYILIELNKEIIKHQTVSAAVTEEDIGTDGLWIIFGFIAIFIFLLGIAMSLADDESNDSNDKDKKGYYRKQVYKRHGKWYNKETDRSYDTAAAASVALALIGRGNDYDSSDSDDDDSSSSGSSFSGGSFGGGSFGGGGSGF